MTIPPLITGPVPPYNNPVIQPYFYIPSRFFISDVTQGETTIITTTEPMDYVIGQTVRILIPPRFGIRELNNKIGNILSIISQTQIEIDIFSLGMSAFISTNAATQPQIMAIGDVNSGKISNTGRVIADNGIPGAFKNISP